MISGFHPELCTLEPFGFRVNSTAGTTPLQLARRGTVGKNFSKVRERVRSVRICGGCRLDSLTAKQGIFQHGAKLAGQINVLRIFNAIVLIPALVFDLVASPHSATSFLQKSQSKRPLTSRQGAATVSLSRSVPKTAMNGSSGSIPALPKRSWIVRSEPDPRSIYREEAASVTPGSNMRPAQNTGRPIEGRRTTLAPSAERNH